MTITACSDKIHRGAVIIKIIITDTTVIYITGSTTDTGTIIFSSSAPLTKTILDTIVLWVIITHKTFIFIIVTITNTSTIKFGCSFTNTCTIIFSSSAPFAITVLDTVIIWVIITNKTFIFITCTITYTSTIFNSITTAYTGTIIIQRVSYITWAPFITANGIYAGPIINCNIWIIVTGIYIHTAF